MRIVFWTVSILYIFMLPYVIFVYNILTRYFSSYITGKIPAALSALFGLFYILFIFITKREKKSITLIIPCALIVSAVIYLEPNTNKQIHIPEYIIMSFLFYRAFSFDYRGNGLLILVLFCSSFAGVIDEIEQGIMPSRFYGWIDMLINLASSLTGVLLLYGLQRKTERDWNWVNYIKKYRIEIVFILSGLAASVLTCIYLFRLHTSGSFHEVYPVWIFAWNILYLPLAVILACKIKSYLQRCRIDGDAAKWDYAYVKTAYLWILTPMLLLFILNTLVIFIAVYKPEFR